MIEMACETGLELHGSHFMRLQCTLPGAREALEHELSAKEEVSCRINFRFSARWICFGLGGSSSLHGAHTSVLPLPQLLTSHGDSFGLPLRLAAEAHV